MVAVSLVAARTPLALPSPVAARTPVCDPSPASIHASAADIRRLAACCTQWVGLSDYTPPDQLLIDADVFLLALVDVWLGEACAGRARAIDVLAVASRIAGHPAKQHLCNLYGKPVGTSPLWPDSHVRRKGNHKVLLDRCRKMDAAGLLALERPISSDPVSGHRPAYDYLVSPRQTGLVRAVHLADRIGYRLPIIHKDIA